MIASTGAGPGINVSSAARTFRCANVDDTNANSNHVGTDISACSGAGRKVGMTISREPYDLNFVSVC